MMQYLATGLCAMLLVITIFAGQHIPTTTNLAKCEGAIQINNQKRLSSINYI
jgi:hypothetical protein